MFLDSETLIVEDKNIVLGNVTGATGPTDDTANGGGIPLVGGTGNDKTTVI